MRKTQKYKINPTLQISEQSNNWSSKVTGLRSEVLSSNKGLLIPSPMLFPHFINQQKARKNSLVGISCPRQCVYSLIFTTMNQLPKLDCLLDPFLEGESDEDPGEVSRCTSKMKAGQGNSNPSWRSEGWQQVPVKAFLLCTKEDFISRKPDQDQARPRSKEDGTRQVIKTETHFFFHSTALWKCLTCTECLHESITHCLYLQKV